MDRLKRGPDAAPVIRASAERPPLADAIPVDAAMALQDFYPPTLERLAGRRGRAAVGVARARRRVGLTATSWTGCVADARLPAGVHRHRAGA
mgnify:CR=1 FL=1